MARNYAIPIVIALATIHAAMATDQIPDAREFFAKNITYRMNVTWDHRVNSKAGLEAAQSNAKIMMLEADVVIGNHTNATGVIAQNTPIMAHPPNKTSDLSLQEFLTSVLAKKNQGIKLDFKTFEAFTESRTFLDLHRKNMKVPVFLNADILPGPALEGKANALPVDAARFLLGASSTLPSSILSIGWTTPDSAYNMTNSSYTHEHAKLMVSAIKTSEIKSSITFPVRAALAVNSNGILTELLHNTTAYNSTLTIWTTESDIVDWVKLGKFIKAIGLDKVYLDIPETVKPKLDIHPDAKGAASSSAFSAVMLVGTIIASFAMAKLI